MKAPHPGKGNFFQRLSPLLKLLISVAFAIVVYLAIPCSSNKYFNALIVWDLFSFCYLLLCWIVFFTMPIRLIRHNASKEDGSKVYVFAMIILSSFAGMVAVLLLIKEDIQTIYKPLLLIVVLLGMIFSWAIVHTVFTFHYGHLFYSGKYEGGLEFPGDEKEPDYLDFAYFSFVIGCTFQVSDVEISLRKIRRLALFHGLLAFMLNTFVVALSINIISGLLK